MAVAIASELGKDMSGQPLLRGVSFKLERGDRLTLSGRNGSGKTTLLRMLAGETSVDSGALVFEKAVRVALHDQRPPREQGVSLRQYVLSGAADLVALEDELTRLEQAMADGAIDAGTLDAYARAQGRLEHAGGYTWRERALSVVRGLGFRDDELDRPLATFSGGELTRGSLARVLAGAPDLLLLDEPTNHLDVASLEWLEATLLASDAAVVLVAHDRWFLEAVGTAVLELAGGRSRYFSGPWHAWRKESAAREIALGRAIERQQAEIARLERFVTRFRAGTRARQAESRQKRLDRTQRIERAPTDSRGLGFSFAPPQRSGRVVLEVEGGSLSVAGRNLLETFDLWLERGEHVSLVGPNGAGKTTLIDVLAGERPLDDGKLRRGHNARIGYLSQHTDELGAQGTVLESAQRATGLTPNRARALLGRFLFSGDEAEKPLAGLSGGERRRLSLAVLVNSGANVLILDEPTNHLDLDGREALEDALRSFEGTLLLVSHDRALLDAVGTRTLAIEDGSITSYSGGWAEYVRARDARREQSQRDSAPARSSARRVTASKPNAAGSANSSVSRSVSSKSRKSRSGATKSSASNTDSSSSGATKSSASNTDSSRSGAAQPSASNTDSSRSGAAQPSASNTDSSSSGAAQPSASNTDSSRSGAAQPSASNTDSSRVDAANANGSTPNGWTARETPDGFRPRGGGGPSKQQARRVAALERRIEAAEAALAALEDELADPSAWSDRQRSERSSQRHSDARDDIERLYEELSAIGA